MTKIDIFSGFLGAGKTTLIKKLLSEAFSNEQIVIIENEFGEIGIDSGFLKEAGVQITEMNQGCICCSLVGDFATALKEVIETYNPDRILIEPSGVGKLSDVIKAVEGLNLDNICLNSYITVADATKVKIYMKNFGEFYNNQIENAGTIILSRTANISEEKLEKALELIREKNHTATIVTTDWDKIDGKAILSAMENADSLKADIEELQKHHHHHTHEECEDEHCDCHNHHHECDDENCDCHHHDEHHHHEHHHEHGEECSCGCGHDHHHHHADEVFSSFGKETVKKFSIDDIRNALNRFDEESKYGVILRAKGIVQCVCGEWIHFDYVPGEINVRKGEAGVIGRLCIIGKDLNETAIEELFNI